jgi:hypothetical protein
VKVTFPQDEKHRSLQHEPVLKRRLAEPVKEALNGILREGELKVLTPVPRQFEQASTNRLGAVPALRPFHIASR